MVRAHPVENDDSKTSELQNNDEKSSETSEDNPKVYTGLYLLTTKY